jgi:hypothetical protein
MLFMKFLIYARLYFDNTFLVGDRKAKLACGLLSTLGFSLRLKVHHALCERVPNTAFKLFLA